MYTILSKCLKISDSFPKPSSKMFQILVLLVAFVISSTTGLPTASVKNNDVLQRLNNDFKTKNNVWESKYNSLETRNDILDTSDTISDNFPVNTLENNDLFDTNELSEVILDNRGYVEDIDNAIPVLVPTNEKKERPQLNLHLPNSVKNELKTLTKDPNRSDEAAVTNINIYADHLLGNIALLMKLFYLDPTPINDVHEKFEKDLYFMTYTGELNMTDGLLYYLSTIHRNGDTVVTFDSSRRYIRIDVPIAFDQLQSTYNYTANFMGLAQQGAVVSKVNNVEMEISISVDFETYKASLDSLKITNSGYINIEFMGEPITDWFINFFNDVLTFLLHQLILDQVSGMMREQLTTALDSVNDLLQTIAHPSRMEAIVSNFIQEKIDNMFS